MSRPQDNARNIMREYFDVTKQHKNVMTEMQETSSCIRAT